MIKRKYCLTLFLCFIVGIFSSTQLSRAEGTRIGIASITRFQYSAIIVYSENIQDQLDNPENSNKNFTTYITIEANSEIIASMICILSSTEQMIVYTLNDPRSQTPIWNNGEPGIHIKSLDSTSIQINLLEITMISTATSLIFKAYSIFDEGGIEDYEQKCGTFLMWNYPDFTVSSNIEDSNTSSSTNTTISDTISNSTNGNEEESKRLSIAGIPLNFLIFSSVPVIVLLIRQTKKKY
ncbi:hypothetical protein [Candidatus Lokiarchaeum ossiferum]|uniref:hypothetical protein n=1 Tax=Candidatus Lokiarchaeum ossiferum TaxID=2951803 RepID=UPI00352C3892